LNDKTGAKAKDIARTQGMPQRTPEEREKGGHFAVSLDRHKAYAEAEMEPRIRAIRAESTAAFDDYWKKRNRANPWPLHREAKDIGRIKAENVWDEESRAKENAAMAKLPAVTQHAKVQEKAVVNGAKVRHPNGVKNYKRAERRYKTQNWLADQRMQLELKRQREEEERILAQEAKASYLSL
jgi:hypothetical protein